MNTRHASIGIVTLVLFAFFTLPYLPHAQSEDEVSAENCRAKVVRELGEVRDEFRAHVFGAREDRNGDGELLTGGTVDSSLIMTGILETKGRLSSELVEPVVRSYRIFRCRSIAVCETAKQSPSYIGGYPIQIHPLGCAMEEMESYGECAFNDANASLTSEIPNLVTECRSLVTKSLTAERAVLRLAFAYDTGYRAMLQMGGMIDWMKEDAPTQVLSPIRDMINLLGKLHEIPCFIGQCDNPDTSGITSSPEESSSSSSSSSS